MCYWYAYSVNTKRVIWGLILLQIYALVAYACITRASLFLAP